MMARYLVTGGAGFIGSNIVDELIRRGQEVRVLDDLSTGREENIAPVMDKIEFIRGDIRSRDDVSRAVESVDYVIHQAARRSVAKSVEQPWENNDVNVNGTLLLLLRSREAGVRRLVNASSSSVYGPCEEYPQREDMATGPISPYAVSKLAAEHYCRMFPVTMGMETVSLRYFNVFGPRQNPESIYSAVIPAFISRLAGDRPCVIHGDGQQSRDFTYVSNVVDANLAACLKDGVSGGVFNVACGDEHSVLELADVLKEIMGKDMDHEFSEKRPGDVPRSLADISGLKDHLGVTELIGFSEGLERTVEWYVNKAKG